MAGFFALPIAGAALPAKLLLTGVLENGALKLTLSLPPRQGPRKGEPLTLADWDGPDGITAGPNSIVREALKLLAADYPLFAEFGPNFDLPSRIERSRWEYFLFTELPELSACGVDAVLPESMRRIEKPEIVLTARRPAMPECKSAWPLRACSMPQRLQTSAGKSRWATNA